MNWTAYFVILAVAVVGCYGRGWKIREYHLDAETTVTKAFTSPGFPYMKYRKLLSYDWYITAPAGTFVQVSIHPMYIEESDACQYDYLDLFDGSIISKSKRIARLCGESENVQTFTSSHTDMVVSFQSDDTVNDIGFKVYFKAIEIVTTSTTTAAPSTTTTTSATTTTTTVPITTTVIPTTITDTVTSNHGTTTHSTTIVMTKTTNNQFTTTHLSPLVDTTLPTASTEITTSGYTATTSTDWITTSSTTTTTNNLEGMLNGLELPKCQHYFPNHRVLIATTEKQYFQSSGYPVSYTRNLKEEWLIVKPNESAPLAIVVKDADLEQSSGCGYDRVVVYDHACPFSTNVGVFCGSDKPSYTLTGGQFALVQFSVDTSNHGRGIKVQYYIGIAPKSNEEDDDDDELKNMLLGIIITIVICTFVVGLLRCVLKCKRRRELQRKRDRQRMNMATTSIREIVSTRSNNNPRVVTISSVSRRTDVQMPTETLTSGTGGSTGSLPYSDSMVLPPSYSALLSTTHLDTHMPNSLDLPRKLPLYEEPSCDPPPYTVSGMKMMSTRTSRDPRERSNSQDRPPPVYTSNVINVEPPSNARDIISPPPAYEDPVVERPRGSQRRTRRIIQ